MALWLRRLAMLWLVLGAIVFLHGAMTGDGLAGELLYRELAARHTASPMVVSELLLLPLCVVPLAILLGTMPKTPPVPPRAAAPAVSGMPARALLLGGLLGGTIALAMRSGGDPRLRAASLMSGAIALLALLVAGWSVISNAAPGYTADVDLDTGQPIPPATMVRVTGVLQNQLAFAYREESEVRGTTYGTAHNLVPLTATSWRPGQPIRVLADFSHGFAGGTRIKGWLDSAPPGYVRRVLRDNGLNLATDLVTLQDTPPGTKSLAFALAIGLVALAMSFAFGFAAQHSRPTPD